MPDIEDLAIAELSKPERAYLEKKHPELGSTESAMVVAAADSMLSVVRQFAALLAERNEQSQQLIDALLAGVQRQVPDEAYVVQLTRNAEARARFLHDVPTLTSADIARVTGSSAKNVAAKANRMKSDRQIFSVTFKNADYFPAFQFGADGEPRPVIRKIVDLFGDRAGWELALWFTAPNSWLNGDTPASTLEKDPDAVFEAARRTIEPLEL